MPVALAITPRTSFSVTDSEIMVRDEELPVSTHVHQDHQHHHLTDRQSSTQIHTRQSLDTSATHTFQIPSTFAPAGECPGTEVGWPFPNFHDAVFITQMRTSIHSPGSKSDPPVSTQPRTDQCSIRLRSELFKRLLNGFDLLDLLSVRSKKQLVWPHGSLPFLLKRARNQNSLTSLVPTPSSARPCPFECE